MIAGLDGIRLLRMENCRINLILTAIIGPNVNKSLEVIIVTYFT